MIQKPLILLAILLLNCQYVLNQSNCDGVYDDVIEVDLDFFNNIHHPNGGPHGQPAWEFLGDPQVYLEQQNIDLINIDFTVSFFLKQDDFYDVSEDLFDFRSSDTVGVWAFTSYFENSGGKQTWYPYTYGATITRVVDPNVWQFFTLKYFNGYYILYSDGVFDKQVQHNNPPYSQIIDKYSFGNDWSGIISQFRIHTKELNDQQIECLYNGIQDDQTDCDAGEIFYYNQCFKAECITLNYNLPNLATILDVSDDNGNIKVELTNDIALDSDCFTQQVVSVTSTLAVSHTETPLGLYFHVDQNTETEFIGEEGNFFVYEAKYIYQIKFGGIIQYNEYYSVKIKISKDLDVSSDQFEIEAFNIDGDYITQETVIQLDSITSIHTDNTFTTILSPPSFILGDTIYIKISLAGTPYEGDFQLVHESSVFKHSDSNTDIPIVPLSESNAPNGDLLLEYPAAIVHPTLVLEISTTLVELNRRRVLSNNEQNVGKQLPVILSDVSFEVNDESSQQVQSEGDLKEEEDSGDNTIIYIGAGAAVVIVILIVSVVALVLKLNKRKQGQPEKKYQEQPTSERKSIL